MKHSLFFVLFMLGCEPEVGRLYRLRLVNESGLNVKKATVLFEVSMRSNYCGEPIEVANIANGKTFDIVYNLEHTTCFQNMTRRLIVEFDDTKQKPLELQMSVVDNRRDFFSYQIAIKKDTLLRSPL
jgi:hypothetical protein